MLVEIERLELDMDLERWLFMACGELNEEASAPGIAAMAGLPPPPSALISSLGFA